MKWGLTGRSRCRSWVVLLYLSVGNLYFVISPSSNILEVGRQVKQPLGAGTSGWNVKRGVWREKRGARAGVFLFQQGSFLDVVVLIDSRSASCGYGDRQGGDWRQVLESLSKGWIQCCALCLMFVDRHNSGYPERCHGGGRGIVCRLLHSLCTVLWDIRAQFSCAIDETTRSAIQPAMIVGILPVIM